MVILLAHRVNVNLHSYLTCDTWDKSMQICYKQQATQSLREY